MRKESGGAKGKECAGKSVSLYSIIESGKERWKKGGAKICSLYIERSFL